MTNTPNQPTIESLEEKIYCPYCGKEAEWVENKIIYGRNYGRYGSNPDSEVEELFKEVALPSQDSSGKGKEK